MSDDVILREVDDELRRDRLRALWRRAGPYVMAAAVAVVVLVAGYEGYDWWQKTTAAEASGRFYAAAKLADGDDRVAAFTALETVAAGGGGYATLARFRAAALLAQDGKRDEAVAAYDGLATALTDRHLRDLALTFAAYLLVDGGDLAAVEQRVNGALAGPSPLRHAAREALGLVAYNAGKLDAAHAHFEAIIADPLAAPEMTTRARLYAQQLVAEGAKPAMPVAEDAPAAP